MIGYDGYRLESGQAGKYGIGLNIVRRGKIGVKGLFLEYGEYSAEYSPTPSLKPLSWVRIFRGVFSGYVGFCMRTMGPWVSLQGILLYMCVEETTLSDTGDIFETVYDNIVKVGKC